MAENLIAIHQKKDPFLDPIRGRLNGNPPMGSKVVFFKTLAELACSIRYYKGCIHTLEIVAHATPFSLAGDTVGSDGYNKLVEELGAKRQQPRQVFLTGCHTGIACDIGSQGVAFPCIAQAMAESLGRCVWGTRGFVMRSALLEGDLLCTRYDEKGRDPYTCSVTTGGLGAFHQFCPTGRIVLPPEHLSKGLVHRGSVESFMTILLTKILQRTLQESTPYSRPALGVGYDFLAELGSHRYAFYYNGRGVLIDDSASGLRVESSEHELENLRTLWRLRWA